MTILAPCFYNLKCLTEDSLQQESRGVHYLNVYFCVFRTKVENTMDPRVKPEDDDLKCLFLFVIPADLKRESTRIVVN